MRTLFVNGRRASGKCTLALTSFAAMIALGARNGAESKPHVLCIGCTDHAARVIENRLFDITEQLGFTGRDGDRGLFSSSKVSELGLVALDRRVDYVIADGPLWSTIAPWARANSANIGTLVLTAVERP